MSPNKHQQMTPTDLAHHPRPAEREIYRKPASQTHRERPALLSEGGSENG